MTDDDTRTPYNDSSAAAEADYWLDDWDDYDPMRPTRSEADEDARTPIVDGSDW